MEKNNFSYAKRKIIGISIFLIFIMSIAIITAQVITYDSYNGYLNNTLWMTAGTGVFSSFFATSNTLNSVTGSATSGYSTSQYATIAMPGLTFIKNVTFQEKMHINITNLSLSNYNASSSLGACGYLNLTIFGNQIFNLTSNTSNVSITCPSVFDFTNWSLVRNNNQVNYTNYTYDNFNDASINPLLWTVAYQWQNGAAEDGGYLKNQVDDGSAYWTIISSTSMPDVTRVGYVEINYTNMQIFVAVNAGCGHRAEAEITLFGTSIKNLNCSTCIPTSYTCGAGPSSGQLKAFKSGNNFDIYDNGIFVKTITPTTNVIQSSVYTFGVSGTYARVWLDYVNYSAGTPNGTNRFDVYNDGVFLNQISATNNIISISAYSNNTVNISDYQGTPWDPGTINDVTVPIGEQIQPKRDVYLYGITRPAGQTTTRALLLNGTASVPTPSILATANFSGDSSVARTANFSTPYLLKAGVLYIVATDSFGGAMSIKHQGFIIGAPANPPYPSVGNYIDWIKYYDGSLRTVYRCCIESVQLGIPFGNITVLSELFPIYFNYNGNTITNNQTNPLNNSIPYGLINFTVVSTSYSIFPIANVSLVLDGIVNETKNASSQNTNTSTDYFYRDLLYLAGTGTHIWSAITCDTNNLCFQGQDFYFTPKIFTINNMTYNSTTYETSSETFTLNLYNTTNTSTAYLYYEGTPYLSTKTILNTDNLIFTNTIDIPTLSSPVTTNNSFYWLVDSSITPVQNQTTYPINFSVCGGGGGNTTFITFEYFDELSPTTPVNLSVQDSTFIYWLGNGNTNKTYLYASPKINGTSVTSTQLGFCFTPSSKTLYTNVVYSYGETDTIPNYPFRTFFTSANIIPFFTSSSAIPTVQPLYTLSTTESTPVTFQISDSTSANVIPGALVTITRRINGITTQIFGGFTDSAGTVTVWLNTVSSYTVTATKEGCGSNTQTITPVSSYNMQLNCAGNLTKYSSQINGVTYQRSPNDGATTFSGNINFEYVVYSLINPITSAKFSIVDGEGNIISTNETYASSGYPFCNTTTCALSLQYTTTCGDNIKGRYYVNLGNETNFTYVLLEKDALWRYICINQNNSQLSFTKMINHFNDWFFQWSAGGQAGANCRMYTDKTSCNAINYCRWLNYTGYEVATETCVIKDNYNKAEFSMIVFIFFGMVIVLFIIGKSTGYEMTNPGSFVAFMTGAIVIMSIAGMFRFAGATPWPWFDQYIYAFICVCFSLGYNISIVRRYSM
jgi:hypothetical protein